MEFLQRPAYRPVDQAEGLQQEHPEPSSPRWQSEIYPSKPQTSLRRKPVPNQSVEILSDSTISAQKEAIILEKPWLTPGWWARTLFFLDQWSIWEKVGLLGSALGLIAIAILLRRYDHEQVPAWSRVSLNTVVSWLSTTARLLISIPISSSIGQLKWIWIADKKRTMADLGAFDSASRGVLGSFGLIWKIRGRHIAALGAFATILAVAFDPFNQYLIEYYQGSINDPSQFAYLANASSYQNPWQNPDDIVCKSGPTYDRRTYQHIGHSAASGPNSASQHLQLHVQPKLLPVLGTPEFICTTGNCTWGPTPNLEVRSLCSDITSHIQRDCRPPTDQRRVFCNQTIPKSSTIKYSYSSNSSLWDGEIMTLAPTNSPLVYTNSTYGSQSRHRSPNVVVLHSMMPLDLVASRGVNMSGAISNNTRWIATECSLELYVRSVNASVQNSTYHETTLATWSDTITRPWSLDVNNSQTFVGFIVPENASLGVYPGQEFIYGRGARSSIFFGLWQWFNGTVIGFANSPQSPVLRYSNLNSNTAHPISQDILETLMLQNFATCPSVEEKFSCFMSNVASGMSKTFHDSALNNARVAGFNASGNSPQNMANMTVGQTLVSVAFVRVRWPWLTLSMLVWVSAAVTWITTLFLTRGAKLRKWRNKILPLLFLYRGSEIEGSGYGVSSLDFAVRAEGILTKLYLEPHQAKLG